MNDLDRIKVVGATLVNGDLVEIGVRLDGSPSFSMHSSSSKVITELKDKITKLKQLLLLTDPCVSNIEVSELQVKQWGEYCSVFPDEASDI